MIDISKNSEITTHSIGNDEIQILPENTKRIGVFFSVEGGDLFLKLGNHPGTGRSGIILKPDDPPFDFRQTAVFYGEIRAINRIENETVTLYVTEIDQGT